MPYPIITKDGIEVSNIPDDIDPNDQRLKDLVRSMRVAGQTSADFMATIGATTTTTVPAPTVGAPPAGQGVPADKTSLLNMMGGVVRGAGPVATGAALGAAIGAPFAGFGAIPGAMIGASAAGVTQLIGDPIVSTINNLFGTKYSLPTDAMEDFFTRIGVAQPRTEAERVVQAAASGAAGGVGTVALGQALQTGAGLAPTVAKGVGKALASGPAQQVLGGVGSGAASQIAAESGAGPLGQFGAGLVGGMAGSALAAPLDGISITPANPQKAQAIIDAGEQAKVRVLTSDVKPPQTFAGRWLRGAGEKIPLTGTGGLRSAQQSERVGAVKNLLRHFGVDDVVSASDDVARDLLGKRSGDMAKWSALKNEVIDRLSFPQETAATQTHGGMSRQPGAPLPSPTATALPTGRAPRALPDNLNVSVPLQGLDDNLPNIPGRELQATGTGSGGLLRAATAKGALGPVAPQVSQAGTAQAGISATGIPNRFIVPMPITMQKIDDSIAYLKSLKTKTVNPAIDVLEDWKQAIQGQDLRNIETLRAQVGDAFDALDAPNNDSFKRLRLKLITGTKNEPGIYQAVNEDMGNFINANGNPNDFSKWKIANAEESKILEEFKLPLLKMVARQGNITPEVINRLIFSNNRSDVEALYRNLTPSGQASARTAILARAASRAGDGTNISPDRFATEVKKLGDQIGVMFSGDDLRQVNGLVRVLDATRRASEAAAMPATGIQAVIPTTAAALASFFGGGIQGFIASMATTAGAGGTARLYESPAVRDILIKLPTIKIGSKEEAALFKRLLEAAQGVQAVRPVSGGAH